MSIQRHSSCPDLPPSLKLRRPSELVVRRSLGGDGIRASIEFHKGVSKKMDGRVKPGHDERERPRRSQRRGPTNAESLIRKRRETLSITVAKDDSRGDPLGLRDTGKRVEKSSREEAMTGLNRRAFVAVAA